MKNNVPALYPNGAGRREFRANSSVRAASVPANATTWQRGLARKAGNGTKRPKLQPTIPRRITGHPQPGANSRAPVASRFDLIADNLPARQVSAIDSFAVAGDYAAAAM
jgi:hypothetical protein